MRISYWSSDVCASDLPVAVEIIKRNCKRPLRLLGFQRQRIHSNWKLAAENSRDPYHAGLLQLFLNTFGLWRNTSESASIQLDRKNGRASRRARVCQYV